MKVQLSVLALCVALFSCSTKQAPLVAEDVEITRPLPGVRMSAGYLTLRNTTDEPIRINRVESPQLETVAMHESVLEDGVARMYPLSELVILAGRSVAFEAGSMHLMIRHPKLSTDDITLQFFDDDTMLLSINVHSGG